MKKLFITFGLAGILALIALPGGAEGAVSGDGAGNDDSVAARPYGAGGQRGAGAGVGMGPGYGGGRGRGRGMGYEGRGGYGEYDGRGVGRAGRMGPAGAGAMGRGGGGLGSRLLSMPMEIMQAKLALTNEQADQIQAVRGVYIKDTEGAVAELTELINGVRREMHAISGPDRELVLNEQDRIHELRGEISLAAVNARLEIIGLFTDAQRSIWSGETMWRENNRRPGGGPYPDCPYNRCWRR